MRQSVFIPLLIFIISMAGISSCVVHAPKFTTVEKVLSVKLGSSMEQVSETLGIPPYNLKTKTDSETVLLYKYRLSDRVTAPFLLKEANGKKVRGRYTNLMVTFDSAGAARRLETCDRCDDSGERTKRLDINQVMTLFTVTLPIILVFLGIKYQ